jgi:methionyl-tRNA formyltransferase
MERIVLFLMNEKGEGVLRGVIDTFGADAIKFVVAPQPHDSSPGDRFVEIRDLCAKHGIEYHSRDKHPAIDGYAITVGWRWMINDVKKLIVTHDSLLPRYRGFAPLINALINGEKKVGVTAFIANGRFDEGPILAQKSIAISYPITIQEAISSVVPLYSGLVNDIIEQIRSGKEPKGKAQNEKEATYSLWLEQEDYRIDWNQDAATIKRFIDAVGSPYEGASTMVDSQLFRVHASETAGDAVIERRQIGKILFLENGIPTVVCGTGLLKITEMRDHTNEKSALPWTKIRTRFR